MGQLALNRPNNRPTIFTYPHDVRSPSRDDSVSGYLQNLLDASGRRRELATHLRHDAVDLGSEALSSVVEDDCQKWVT